MIPCPILFIYSKNHNFHFLKFLVFTKVTHFSRESMVVGGRLNIIEVLPHYGQRL